MVLGMFILVSNLLGLIPGLESPTGKTVVPLGCALATWVYYHIQGLKKNGPVGYVKHFMGPVWWLAILMFPIEIFSHLARILSLTVRLFANMFAGEMVTLVFFSLLPIGIPVLFRRASYRSFIHSDCIFSCFWRASTWAKRQRTNTNRIFYPGFKNKCHQRVEDTLDRTGFFKTADKRPTMVDNLRAAFSRAQLSTQEIRTLRGVISSIDRSHLRAGWKKKD